MFAVKITAIRCADYRDLQEKYENPIEHTCDVREGMEWVSREARRPEGFCEEAWKMIKALMIIIKEKNIHLRMINFLFINNP